MTQKQAYYPTAPDRVAATGYLENIHIQNYGLTNFTYPIHMYYNQASDTNLAMLRDISTKCSSGQQLEVNADISVVVSIIGIHIPIPTIHHPISFDCPIPVSFFPCVAILCITLSLSHTHDIHT